MARLEIVAGSPFGTPRSSVGNRLAAESARRQARIEDLRLWKRPLRTLYHFGCVAGHAVTKAVGAVWATSAVKWGLAPVLSLWTMAVLWKGPQTPLVHTVHAVAQFAIWWLGLGILSSIGVGCGIQSGLLFLFPHIIKVALVAQECSGMGFESASDMWFRHAPGAFACAPDASGQRALGGGEAVGFDDIMVRVLPAVLLFGMGTAIGEIPPYVVAKAAAATGKANAELAGLMAPGSPTPRKRRASSSRPPATPGKPAGPGGSTGGVPTGSFGRIQAMGMAAERSMLRFLERNGFWGVFVLAAVPNPAFDLCGIFCGQTKLPFVTFLVATILGKALVKTPLQAALVVCAFHRPSLRQILALVDAVTPDALGIEAMVMGMLEQGRAQYTTLSNGDVGVAEEDAGDASGWNIAHVVARAWALVMVGVVLYFVVSCIEQCAHYHVNEADREQLHRLQRDMAKRRRDSYHASGLSKMAQAARASFASEERQHKVHVGPEDQQRRDRTPLEDRMSAAQAPAGSDGTPFGDGVELRASAPLHTPEVKRRRRRFPLPSDSCSREDILDTSSVATTPPTQESC